MFDTQFTLRSAYDGKFISSLTSFEPESTDNQGIATMRQELKEFFRNGRKPIEVSMYASYDKFVLALWFGPFPRKYQKLNDLTVLFRYFRPDDAGMPRQVFADMQRELERLLGGQIDTNKIDFFKTYKKSL